MDNKIVSDAIQIGKLIAKGFIEEVNKNLAEHVNGMVSLDSLQSLKLHLDNTEYADNGDISFPSSEEENEMSYKIKRTVDIGGKKKTIYANTEQEYAAKLVAAMGFHTDICALKPKHLLSNYCKNWFDTFAKPNIQTATAEQYRRAIDTKIIPYFKDMFIEDVTVTDLQCFFNSMDGLAKESKLKVKTPLLMIFDMAVENGLIAKNPMKSRLFKINGAKSKETDPYTKEQMHYLVSNIGNLENPCDRNYLAIQCLHPLRMEEALGLQWCDIDLDNNTLTVRQVVTHPTRNQPEVKAPKTESSSRILPLSHVAKRYLVPGKPDEYVIGGNHPLSYSLVRKMCERIAQTIRFEDKITPRRFRATVLTDIYDQTKDIKLTQSMAGHSNSQMTLKHYVKGRSLPTQSDVISELYEAR